MLDYTVSTSQLECKKNFGRLVRTFRHQLGISRELLAYKSNLSFKTIGDVERGEKVILDHALVSALAFALEVGKVDEDNFFAAAGLMTLQEPSVDQTQLELIRRFYQHTTLPAFVHDPLLDFHSVNAYFLALFGGKQDNASDVMFTGAGANILRCLFDPAFNVMAVYGDVRQWQAFARASLYRFRLRSQKRVGTKRYIELFTELAKLPRFLEMWESVQPTDRIENLCLPLTLYPKTNQEMTFLIADATTSYFPIHEFIMTTYIPCNESTRNRLADLKTQVHNSALRLDGQAKRIRPIWAE